MAEHTFAELTDAIADYSDAKDEEIMTALTDEVKTRGELGAKNLLPNIAVDKSDTDIHFTVNSDKSITIGAGSTEGTIFYPIDCLSLSDVNSSDWNLTEFRGKQVTASLEGNTNSGISLNITFFDSSGNADGTNPIITTGPDVTGTIRQTAYKGRTFIRISGGTTLSEAITVYPMVRLASDTDNTYQPYAKTNQQLTTENQALTNEVKDMNNVLGSKNLLPNDIFTTGTFGGVQLTINDDYSVTFNGTATGSVVIGNSNASLHPITLEAGKYIISVNPSNTMPSGTFNIKDDNENSIVSFNMANINEAEFTLSTKTHVRCYVIINSGNVYNAVTIYPMLRLASITDDTYEPYAKTNQELTFLVSRIKGMQLPIIDLGTSYTAELKADISSGKFKKAVVGGKLTINNHVYYLAHPDYWLNTGDTACNTHHMLVVPEVALGNGKMNSSNDTTGAYVGCGLKTGTNLDQTANSALSDVAAIIKADFGAANILTHRELFTNATVDGKSSGWAWYDSDIDLMNEAMVYGCHAWAGAPKYETGIDKTQIKLFAERPDLITTRARWWLRDVVSGAAFALVHGAGNAGSDGASNSYGVRPVFAIC